MREAEAFIRVNSPGTAPGSLVETPSFPLNLGVGGGMVLPIMRTSSMGATVGIGMLVAANSGKSVDERNELGNLNPTFGGLIASNFDSRIASGEITENAEDHDSLMYDNNEYSRNISSLGGGTLEGASGLAGMGAFEKPKLRNHKALIHYQRW